MIAIGGRNELAPHLVRSMHEFRHTVFVRRLGWSLPLLDGLERDQYDNERAVYFVVRAADGHITACARLLPTTAAYMLPDVFPDRKRSASGGIARGATLRVALSGLRACRSAGID